LKLDYKSKESEELLVRPRFDEHHAEFVKNINREAIQQGRGRLYCVANAIVSLIKILSEIKSDSGSVTIAFLSVPSALN
jgi:hypothetical protein